MKTSVLGSKIKDTLTERDEHIRGKCIFKRKKTEAEKIKTVLKKGNILFKKNPTLFHPSPY